MHQSLRLYRASAGAGKTHKLTEEFILLLFSNPDNYKYILAVTFTKKATAEMKSRILQELNKLAKGEKSAHLNEIKKLDGYTNEDESKIQQTARLILKRILHDFSHFSITTIDSFFQKILTSFFKEIGMHSGYTIEMDQDEVIDHVVKVLMLEIGSNKSLTQWMLKFSKEKIVNGEDWDIEKDLKKLAKQIFTEDFKIIQSEIINFLGKEGAVEALQKDLVVIKTTFEKQQSEIGEKGLRVMEKYQLSLDNFSYGKSGVAGSFTKMTKSKFEPQSERVIKAVDNISGWFKKDSILPENLKQAVFDDLNALLKQAIHLHEIHAVKYHSVCQIIPYYNQFGLLAEMIRKLREYCDHEHKLLISDVAPLLNEITAENNSSYVFEKTANWYKHYIIDEFQDTSLFQWSNFKPLIENSLAEGKNLNMIVGDVKQSIYRWRGGNWVLLHNRVEEEINRVESLVLNENWRSGVKIIQFNNSLYKQASRILQNEINTLLPSSSISKETINQVYENSQQSYPSKDNPIEGYVKIKFYNNKDDDEKWQEQVKKELIEQIYSLKELGYNWSDMAILVRNNKEGKDIAETLLQNSIDVISPDSLSISNSAAVKILMGALRYMVNPSDDINIAMLHYEQTKYVGNFSQPTIHEIFTKCKVDYLELLSSINSEALYEVVEEIIRLLQLSLREEEIPYLQAFQDIVLSYSRDQKADITSFIQWWDEYGKNKTILVPENQNAVQVMTIHKSKGLAFKIVFIPFCNWKLETDTKKENMMWVKAENGEFSAFPYLPVKYKKELAQTYFASDYYKEMLNGYIDNLNLLYVASTRASEAMIISSPLPSSRQSGTGSPQRGGNKDFKVATVGDLLYAVLQQKSIKVQDKVEISLSEYWNSESLVFELGKWNETEKKSEVQQVELNTYHSFPWKNRLSIKQNAHVYFPTIDDIDSKKVNYGTIMHDILKNLRKTEDLEKTVEVEYLKGKLSSEEKSRITEVLTTFLNKPEVQDWFSSNWKVKNEKAILLGSGKIKIPDKVLIDGENAIVIDFKTGKQAEKYPIQVREYMVLLNSLGYKNVKGFLAFIEEIRIVEVYMNSVSL